MVDELLKAAKRYIKDPDYILNLFDLSLPWVNDKTRKLFGIVTPKRQLVSLRNIYNLESDSSYVIKGIIEQPNSGTVDFYPDTKKHGKVKLKIKYSNFEFENEKLRVGKILKFVKLEEKK